MITLYYGEDTDYDFWEDESGDYLICRNSNDDCWFAMKDQELIDFSFGTFEHAREMLHLSTKQNIRFVDKRKWEVSPATNEKHLVDS